MGKVSISVNGRAFAVGCEDGEEEAVAALGRQFDTHVSELADQVGQIGDLRLFLMAALVLADKLREAEKTTSTLSAQITKLEANSAEGELKGIDGTKSAVTTLAHAASRIEKLAKQLDDGKNL